MERKRISNSWDSKMSLINKEKEINSEKLQM